MEQKPLPTTRAEEIAGEEYPPITDRIERAKMVEMTANDLTGWERAAFVNGYKQGQQDRWIPDGWALVPLVATPEMLLNAGFPASSTGDSTTGQNTWEWFVKSAPSPPNPEQR